jgi:hypothetical protein
MNDDGTLRNLGGNAISSPLVVFITMTKPSILPAGFEWRGCVDGGLAR